MCDGKEPFFCSSRRSIGLYLQVTHEWIQVFRDSGNAVQKWKSVKFGDPDFSQSFKVSSTSLNAVVVPDSHHVADFLEGVWCHLTEMSPDNVFEVIQMFKADILDLLFEDREGPKIAQSQVRTVGGVRPQLLVDVVEVLKQLSTHMAGHVILMEQEISGPPHLGAFPAHSFSHASQDCNVELRIHPFITVKKLHENHTLRIKEQTEHALLL